MNLNNVSLIFDLDMQVRLKGETQYFAFITFFFW